jgi:hypothetical protein
MSKPPNCHPMLESQSASSFHRELRVIPSSTDWLRRNAETMTRLMAPLKAGRPEVLVRRTAYATGHLAD